MNTEYSPVKPSERILLIDALRGFALFGILMVNMLYMYEPVSIMMLGAKPDATVNHIIFESFIKFFFEGKFYVMFSLLFGFGFWIFMNKSQDHSKSVLSVYKRRLLFLLLFGVAHITLLWAGDILVFYALFGFILLLFRKASDKKIVKWSVAFTLIPTIFMLLMLLLIALLSQQPETKDIIDAQFQENKIEIEELITRATEVYSNGSFSEIVAMRIEEYATLIFGSLFFFCPVVIAMFLIGFLTARKGIVHKFSEYQRLFKKIFWWGLTIGIIANAMYTIAFQKAIVHIPDIWSLLSTAMHSVGGISLGLCYISGIVILFGKSKSALMVKNLAPVGRMALTNYLLQSVCCVILFHPYGFGLLGKVEVWQGIVITVVIYLLQIAFSRWWLRNFQYGPFEWLWRCLTYFKMLPLRKIQ